MGTKELFESMDNYDANFDESLLDKKVLTALEDEETEVFSMWYRFEMSANSLIDYALYLYFLKSMHKEFIPLFLKLPSGSFAKKIVGDIVKEVSCNLKENTIKYKLSRLIGNKNIANMEDKELYLAWQKLKKSTHALMDREGEKDFSKEDLILCNLSIVRIQNLELAMQKRGLNYDGYTK